MSMAAFHIVSHVKQVQAEGRRRYVRHKGMLCSRCLANPPSSDDRYCRPCRAAYQRELRAARKAPQ